MGIDDQQELAKQVKQFIIDGIKEEIAWRKEAYAVYKILLQVFHDNEGKVLNRSIEKKVAKLLPNYYVSYRRENYTSWVELQIGKTYQDKRDFHIADNNGDKQEIDPAYLERANSYYGEDAMQTVFDLEESLENLEWIDSITRIHSTFVEACERYREAMTRYPRAVPMPFNFRAADIGARDTISGSKQLRGR